MERHRFEALVREGFAAAIPERFKPLIKNVAFLVEDEPSEEVRRQEGLGEDETLLGLYVGTPHTDRGEGYGVGPTLPDTITLYQGPIEEAAEGDPERIRDIVAETVWHEVAHYFGFDHDEIEVRERKRLS